jgi:hypothetical protein
LSERARRRRLTDEDVVRLASHLTERDRRIAVDCFDHRVLTTSQLKRLHFTGTRTAVARLGLLYSLRVLDRFRPILARGEGSAPYHWVLDEAGALIVADHQSVERAALGWQHAVAIGVATSVKLAHHVEVNEFFTRLSVEASGAGGALSEWYGERALRPLLGRDVVPDGYGVITLPGRAPIHLLLELDRGSEPSGTLREKAKRYARAVPRSSLRDVDPLALFVVPGRRRAQTAAAALAGARTRLAVTVWSRATTDSVLAAVVAADASRAPGAGRCGTARDGAPR